MKKGFVYCLLFLYFIVFIKFFAADYNISYDIDNYKIKELATDDYIYIEIKDEDTIFNYMFFTGRKVFKKRVKDVKIEEVNGYKCLMPIVKGVESYYVCSEGDNLLSYQMAKKEEIYKTSDDNFKYYENSLDDDNLFIWKYDGFYYLNNNEYKSINIFDKDRYSNDLMISINGYLIFPKYDNNYLFNGFVSLDMSDGTYEFIDSKYEINYDSYIVGNRKNSLYLFDNKELKLYEINYKKGKVELIGDDKKGYIKYVDGKKEDATLSEYVKDKITYFEKDKEYINVDKNYMSYTLNKDNRLNYFNDSDINYVDSVNGSVYFIYKDKLFKYYNSEVKPVLHYFEFNFNKNGNVFVYNK